MLCRKRISDLKVRLFERAAFAELVDVYRYVTSLAPKKILDGCRKLWVGEPMDAVLLYGQQAACDLVFPLGSAFEAGDAVGNTEFDYLVETAFEMQRRMI